MMATVVGTLDNPGEHHLVSYKQTKKDNDIGLGLQTDKDDNDIWNDIRLTLGDVG